MSTVSSKTPQKQFDALYNESWKTDGRPKLIATFQNMLSLSRNLVDKKDTEAKLDLLKGRIDGTINPDTIQLIIQAVDFRNRVAGLAPAQESEAEPEPVEVPASASSSSTSSSSSSSSSAVTSLFSQPLVPQLSSLSASMHYSSAAGPLSPPSLPSSSSMGMSSSHFSPPSFSASAASGRLAPMRPSNSGLKPVGIENSGDDCFLISLLQIIAHKPALQRAFAPTHPIHDFIKKYTEASRPFSVERLRETLFIGSEPTLLQGQHDSHAALMAMTMNRVEEDDSITNPMNQDAPIYSRITQTYSGGDRPLSILVHDLSFENVKPKGNRNTLEVSWDAYMKQGRGLTFAQQPQDLMFHVPRTKTKVGKTYIEFPPQYRIPLPADLNADAIQKLRKEGSFTAYRDGNTIYIAGKTSFFVYDDKKRTTKEIKNNEFKKATKNLKSIANFTIKNLLGGNKFVDKRVVDLKSKDAALTKEIENFALRNSGSRGYFQGGFSYIHIFNQDENLYLRVSQEGSAERIFPADFEDNRHKDADIKNVTETELKARERVTEEIRDSVKDLHFRFKPVQHGPTYEITAFVFRPYGRMKNDNAGRASSSGHYASCVRIDNQWYELNDTNVIKITKGRALNYMRAKALLYFSEKVPEVYTFEPAEVSEEEEAPSAAAAPRAPAPRRERPAPSDNQPTSVFKRLAASMTGKPAAADEESDPEFVRPSAPSGRPPFRGEDRDLQKALEESAKLAKKKEARNLEEKDPYDAPEPAKPKAKPAERRPARKPAKAKSSSGSDSEFARRPAAKPAAKPAERRPARKPAKAESNSGSDSEFARTPAAKPSAAASARRPANRQPARRLPVDDQEQRAIEESLKSHAAQEQNDSDLKKATEKSKFYY